MRFVENWLIEISGRPQGDLSGLFPATSWCRQASATFFPPLIDWYEWCGVHVGYALLTQCVHTQACAQGGQCSLLGVFPLLRSATRSFTESGAHPFLCTGWASGSYPAVSLGDLGVSFQGPVLQAFYIKSSGHLNSSLHAPAADWMTWAIFLVLYSVLYSSSMAQNRG